MSTIYRKYRPQFWKNLVGQTQIKTTLEKELETNKLAHAYLFSGPRGSGKTTAARLLAKSLNCEKRPTGTSEPCNECNSCKEIPEGRSIDVIEIDAASNTGVDNVRENIIESARLLPTKSKFKIFIIDEVHMLSTSAFNALLKILEEPPTHVFFILATTEPFKIPATILSRCQRFNFKKVEIDKIIEKLKSISENEGVKIDKKVLDKVAHQSEGCLRDAEGLLGQLLALGEKNITEETASLVLPRSDFQQIVTLIDSLLAGNAREGIVYINNLLEEGTDLINFTEELIETLRLLMLYKINPNLADLHIALEDTQLKNFQKLGQGSDIFRLHHLMEVILKQKHLLKTSPIQQLPLEMIVLEFCQPHKEDNNKESSTNQQPIASTLKKPEKDTKTTSEVKVEKAAKIEITHEETTALVTLEDIKGKWEIFIQKVQNFNHSLPFILKMGEPLEVRGNLVRIKFKFALHRDKFNEPKIKSLAEKVFCEIFGSSKLALEGLYQEIDSQLDKTSKNADNAVVANLIEEFGGQIIG